MKKYFLISLILISGCANTIITKGKVVDGELIPDEYIQVRGHGGGKFPNGTEGTGKPMFEMPKVEYDN